MVHAFQKVTQRLESGLAILKEDLTNRSTSSMFSGLQNASSFAKQYGTKSWIVFCILWRM